MRNVLCRVGERNGACGGQGGEVMRDVNVLKSLHYNNQAGLRASRGGRVGPLRPRASAAMPEQKPSYLKNFGQKLSAKKCDKTADQNLVARYRYPKNHTRQKGMPRGNMRV